MKKSNGGKYILIRRSSAAPKADNTIGMYKRDGQGAYTTSEEDDSVPMTPTQKASDDAEKRRSADAKKREAIQAARERLQQSNKAAREKLQQAKTAKVDETLVKRIILRTKEKAAAIRNPNAHPKDPADNIRDALRKSPGGKKFLRKRVLGNSFDPTLDEIESPVVAATIKQGEDNVAKAKETRRKATHAAMVKRLIAARGTKPKKTLGIWKEGTNARQRGEIQSPRSEKEYDALSPENKKIVDTRTKNATRQSMSRQPGESPRNKRTKKKPRYGEVSSSFRTEEEWGEETLGEDLAYSKPDKKGRTFVVSKRNTKGMRGRQDQVSMSVRDSQGKVVKDIGSHINVKGAKKYATSRGYDMGEGRPWGREVGAEWDEPDGPDYSSSSRRRKAPRKPPPAPPKDYEKKHPLSQKDRAAIRNKLGRKKYPQTEEVSSWDEDTVKDFLKRGGKITKVKSGETVGQKIDWTKPGSGHNIAVTKYKFPRSRKKEEVDWDEAQYWSEDTVADFLKRGGKITKGKSRNAQGATRKKTIRLRGSTKSTADRGRKAEKKMHGEEVEEIDEGGIGSIYPKDKPLQSPTAKATAKRLSKQRAKLRQRLRDDMRGEKEEQKKARAASAQQRKREREQSEGTDEYSLDEAKMKVILKRVIRGASPFTIVALKNGRAIDQEHAKISQAVPAFVREMKKKHPNARISVEDRTGRVLHTEEYIDEGGMGGRHFNVKGGSIPSNAEIKAFYEKQKGSPSQRIAATKKHFGLQKMTVSARGIVSAKGIREAVSVDGRTRDYRGTRTRLEARGRRLGAGLDGRTKGYRDAYARTMARQQRAAADTAMMEPEEAASTEIEEMQSGSKQSPVDASTASSNLKYKSGSRHATGTSKKPEKKRASKAARQASNKMIRIKLNPNKKIGHTITSPGPDGKPGKVLKRRDVPGKKDVGEETIGKEDLKDLIHKRDLDNRHRRREDKAAQRTAKTKRSFGPKGKKPEGTMKIAFRKALEKKQQKK